MSLRDDIRAEPWFDRLGRRKQGFRLAVEHLDKLEEPLIIETGCTRIEDNWEGDGQSTRIWDWVVSQRAGARAVSIDMVPEHCEVARRLAPRVEVVLGESVRTLDAMCPMELDRCGLLYLDSFDWSPELNVASAAHHLAELAAVWRMLPQGCMVMVDDRHGDLQGKHFMVELFMQRVGLEPCYKGYQIAWLK